MSDLREQLSQRLYEVTKPEQLAPEFHAYLVDEVIRQMEWARRECVGCTLVDYDTCEPDLYDLTPAPKDWTP